MNKKKLVKELMYDVFGYPHIPYWFTVKNAMDIIKKSFLENESCVRPMAVLVFDQQYNLMGLVTLRNLIKALEPQLLKPLSIKDAEVAQIDMDSLINYETSMFYEEMKRLSERPVNEIMTPVKVFLSPEDAIIKAAFLMVHQNITIIPVLEDQKKLVGVVRMTDIFKEICNILSE